MAEDKEKVRQYMKEYGKRYRAEHKEKERARQLAYAKANPEKVRARKYKWAANNRDRVRAIRTKYCIKNTEQRSAAFKAWASANPEKISNIRATRRLRKTAGVGRLSIGLVKSLYKNQNGECVSCGCDLRRSGYHLDHIMPLALGGLHEDKNMQLLCPPCNYGKGAKHPKDYMPGFYNEDGTVFLFDQSL